MRRVFISYCHADDSYRRELEKHLKVLKRQNIIDVWSDHCIRPGEELDPAIVAAMERADFFLLLVSTDFIDSDYCIEKEMKHALERHAAKTATVIPIIVRPCDWKHTELGRLKVLPTDGKAVIKWQILDEAFLNITEQLREMLQEKTCQPLRTLESAMPRMVVPAAASAMRQEAVRMPRSSNLALPRRFTDEDRHDFLVKTFSYIQSYFESSLQELEARNTGITSRLTVVSAEAFKAVVFREGRRIAGCRVMIGSSFGKGIIYSGSEAAPDNSYNELLSIDDDKHAFYLTASMGMFNGRNHEGRLTDEGAAEHLWSMFISDLQQ